MAFFVSQPHHHSSVPTGPNQPCHMVPQARCREYREPGVDAPYRPNLHRPPVFRVTKVSSSAFGSRNESQSQASTASDEVDGHRGLVSQAQNLQGQPRSPEVSLSVAWPQHRQVRSGVEHGYHVHKNASWVHVFGGSHRLVQSCGTLVGAVKHTRLSFLHQRTAISFEARQTSDLQHRSGLSVHQHQVYFRTETGSDPNQYGWSWKVGRQRVHREILENTQVRGGLPQRI